MGWEDVAQSLCGFIIMVIAVLVALCVWFGDLPPMLRKSGFAVSCLGNAAGVGGAGFWGAKTNPWNTYNM